MLQRLRTERNFEIFTCLNPEGHLEPFTSCALLFKFTPIEAKKYQVEGDFNTIKNKTLLVENSTKYIDEDCLRIEIAKSD